MLISQVMFGSGRVLCDVAAITKRGRPDGPWVVIDGYHSFMALDAPLGIAAANSAFFLGGGYKYAMAGEGCAFMHCPPGFGPRPPITGWYAEFDELDLKPGQVGYAPDAMRFMGATFDPSGLYRFNAVQRMLQGEGLTTPVISNHVRGLQQRLVDAIGGSPLGNADLITPPAGAAPHARFLAWRTPCAADWCEALMREGCVTDVRGDVLRVGLGLYHDEGDIDDFVKLARALN